MARTATEKKTDRAVRNKVYQTMTANGISNKVLKELDLSAVLHELRDPDLTIRKKSASIKKILAKTDKETRAALVSVLNVAYKDQFDRLRKVVEEVTGEPAKKFTKKAIDAAFLADLEASIKVPMASVGSTPQQMYESTWRALQNGLNAYIQAEAMTGVSSASLRSLAAKFRRDMDSSIRTTTFSMITKEEDRVYKANRDVVRGIMFTAVLDGRTTNFCKSIDGTIVKLSDPMRAPFHVNCRTINVPVMHSETDADAQAALDYRARVGAGPEYEEGARARDKKSTKRNVEKDKIKVSTQKGKASSSYGDFLAVQSRATGGPKFVRDALGKTRGDAFIRAVKDNPSKDMQTILQSIIRTPIKELKN